MRNFSRIIVIAFITMLTAMVSPLTAQINSNTSFEDWTTDSLSVPEHWFGHRTTIARSNVTKVTSPVHTGTYACRLANVTGSHKRFCTDSIPVIGTQSYKISFWVAGKGLIRTALAYNSLNADDMAFTSYNTYDTITGTTTFQYVEQIVTAPEDAYAGQFILSIRNTDAEYGHLIIDDVEITPVSNGLEFPNIAAFKAQSFTGVGSITGDVTFVYRNDNYMFVRDNTAGLLVYDNYTPVITTAYEEGDVIPGITGTYDSYNDQIELKPTLNTAAAIGNVGAVQPVVVTIADIVSNYSQYDAQLVTLQNVTLTEELSFTAGTTGSAGISQNGSNLSVYNRFKTLDTTIASGTVTDVTGFLGIFSNTIQIYPRDNSDLIAQAPVVPVLETPVFTPASGIYTTSVTFTISSAENSAVYYTTDGSEPDESSTLYTGAVTLTASATVKAKAFLDSYQPSATATVEYTIVNEPTLTVTPSALSFNSSTTSQEITISAAYISEPITLTCSDPHFTLSASSLTDPNGNHTVTVTFNGSEPATGIVIIVGDTITREVSLTATALLAAPVFTPASGAIDTALTVTLAHDVAGASIYYTTDGTTPDESATLYAGALTLNTPGSYTFKAVAVKAGWESSAVAVASYTILAPVPQIDDTLIYYTGFEDTEGFIASTVYNNTTEAVSGPLSNEWATLYGTPATNSYICGAQSMQMRWYTSAPATLGYTRTNFDIAHATRVTFTAKSSNGLQLAVSHSTDGGNTYSTPVVYALTSNAQNYSYLVSETGDYDYVRYKFAVVLPDEAPAATSRVVLDSVCFFGVPGMVSTTVSTPVIAPNSGNCYDSVSVTISCPTEGAQIYYTTDGTTPNESATLYTGAFTVTGTTTVKAIAYAFGYNPSHVATATYTFPVLVADIAAFKAANSVTNNTIYTITGDVTFVFESGSNLYIQDNTGGLLIYDNQNIIDGEYEEGDVISGGITGTFTLYNGLVEMVPTRNIAAASGNNGPVAPLDADIEAIEAQYYQYESRLVTLHDVTFTEGGDFTTTSASNMTIELNGETMVVRNVFKTLDMSVEAGFVADVTGFILQYNGAYQIAPRDNSDIVGTMLETVSTPVITVQPLTNNMYSVTLECETEDAVIYYTTDGNAPDENATEYTGIFAVEGGSTIKAIAMKEGMANSAVAVYEHTGMSSLSGLVAAYPNPTTGQITLTYPGVEVKWIRIYSVSGQLLESYTATADQTILNMRERPAGIYFVQMAGDNFSMIQKITKR